MATKFLYTSPEGLKLIQSTEELMLVVDNFQYDVLKPDFSSFGEIHDTLGIRLVSTPDIKKRTIHLTLGFLRDNLKRMNEYNERIASENKAIYEKMEKTRDESLCRYLKKNMTLQYLRIL